MKHTPEQRSRYAYIDIAALIPELLLSDARSVLYALQSHIEELDRAPIQGQLEQASERREPSISYREQYVRCGKASCKTCSAGQGHGPYWYAYWEEGGKTHSRYIGKHKPEKA